MTARASAAAGHRGVGQSRRNLAVWLLVVVDLGLIGAASVMAPTGILFAVILLPVVASFGAVGAIVIERRPSNPIGWMLLAAGTMIALGTAGVTYSSASAASCDGCLPGTVAAAFAANATFVPLIALVGIFVPLLFPDGRLPSPSWRPVAWLAVVATAYLGVLMAVRPGPMTSGGSVQNPIALATDPMEGPLGLIAVVLISLAFVSTVASVVWRFRHTGPVERQQLRWFGAAVLVLVLAIAIGTSDEGAAADLGWLLIIGAMALLPVATGLAILRYRLYDLDRIVSRTIAYALLSGGLLALYLIVNLILTTAFSSVARVDSVAVAASTLVVAALFTPVRRRIQHVVDRRFDRARYDAERTTMAFAARLRNEMDLATVAADLDATVQTAIAPTSMTLWLRDGGER